MAISSGRDVSVFAADEDSYGVPQALTAADYLRVTTAGITNDQLAPIPSPEKTPGRDRAEVFRGRPTTSLSVGTLLRGAPTGVTPPRSAPLLENAMGADAVVVNAAAIVTGAGNTGVPLMVAGAGDGMFRPQLGGAASPLVPLMGAAVYKSVNFPLGDDRKSTTLRYQPLESSATPPGAPAMLVAGWSVNSMTLTVDGSGSPATVEFDGPASRTYHRGGAGAQNSPAQGGAGPNVALPADLTEDQPMSGLVAKAFWRRDGDAGAFTELTSCFRSLTVTLTNNISLRMDEAGSLYSKGVLFTDHRTTTLAVSVWAEADNALWGDIRDGLAAGEPRHYSFFLALGNVEGARFGFYAPKWRPMLPTGDDGDTGIGWEISGELLASPYGAGNSSFIVGLG